MSTIKEEVLEWVKTYPKRDRKVLLEDLQKGGCVSGMVNPMIYYSDTEQFLLDHLEEINALLADGEINPKTGLSLVMGLNGYDDSDPLCLEQNNRNMLAWFAWEETAFRIYQEKYEK